MTPKIRILLGCILITVPADQLAKYWVVTHIPRGGRVSIIEGFFELTHVGNSGGALGLLANVPGAWQAPLMVALTIATLAVIVFFLRDLAPGDRLSAMALALILGGAMGNLCDRLFRGEVIDFLHFRLVGGYSWPDFNLADAFIVAGVAALAIELLAAEGKSRADGSVADKDN